MEKYIYDESNGLTYTLYGEYYLPDQIYKQGMKTWHLMRNMEC